MATKEADKKAADKIKGYEIVVEGQYYAAAMGNRQKGPRNYPRQTFFLPEIVTYREGNTYRKILKDGESVDTAEVIPVVRRGNAKKPALHLILRYHLDPRLKEELEDFIKVRTCRIFSIKETLIDAEETLKKDIDDMTEAELTQFVAVRDLNVFLSLYGDLVTMKEAVKREYKNMLEQLSEKKNVVKEETNIYQAELDSLSHSSVADPLADLM